MNYDKILHLVKRPLWILCVMLVITLVVGGISTGFNSNATIGSPLFRGVAWNTGEWLFKTAEFTHDKTYSGDYKVVVNEDSLYVYEDNPSGVYTIGKIPIRYYEMPDKRLANLNVENGVFQGKDIEGNDMVIQFSRVFKLLEGQSIINGDSNVVTVYYKKHYPVHYELRLSNVNTSY